MGQQFTVEFMEETVQVLQKHREALADQIAAITDEMAGIDKKITGFLAAIREEQKFLDDNPPARRRRGDNVRLIKEWYDTHPQSGFTFRDLIEATGLPHGSIHNVLSSARNGYYRDKGTEMWWRKEDRPQEAENIEDDDPTPTSGTGAVLLGAA